MCDVSAMVHMAFDDSIGAALCKSLDFEDRLCAPDLYAFEATNVFWKYGQANQLSHGQAQELLRLVLEAIDLYFPVGELYEEVLNESVRLSHPAYDVFYLVLARRLGAKLVTCDRRLSNLALSCGIDVVFGPGLV